MKFRLVDQITAWTPWQSISGVKAVSFEEYSLKDAFGEAARFPELLLLESFLQLGNWLVVLSSEFTLMGMVVRISEVCFHEPLLPGQILRLHVRLIQRHEDGFEFQGKGSAGGRSVISGSGCLASPVALKEYHDPEDLRVLYAEICRLER